MDQVKEVAEVVSAVSVSISALIITGIALIKLIAAFTDWRGADRLAEKVKEL